MPADIPTPEFDEIADIFWRLGVMSSPAQLHGYLLGLLAVGYPLKEAEWLELSATFIDPVEPPAEVELQTFAELLLFTQEQLDAGGLDLQLLLPDDNIEISQRVDSLSQWCKGFLAGFALGGQQRKSQQGEQKYSADVSEALSDIATISQASLGEGDEDEQTREKSFFEIGEYLRLAAINIYLECQRTEQAQADEAPASGTSPAALFGQTPPDDKLH